MDTLSLLSRNIAFTLKQLRKSYGWSLDVAAEQTSLSKAMLGKIEREESSPTISTLMKIATGFKVSLSCFLETPQLALDDYFHIAKDDHTYQTGKDMLSVCTIFPFHPATKNEVLLISLQAKHEHLSPMHMLGLTEQIIVKKGSMDVLFDNKWHHLKQGEGIRFRADQPHGYRNKTSKSVMFYSVMTYTGEQP